MKAYKVKATFPGTAHTEPETRETVMSNLSTILTAAEAAAALAEHVIGQKIILTLLTQALDESTLHLEYKFPTGELYLVIDCKLIEVEAKASLTPSIKETEKEEEEMPEDVQTIYSDWLKRMQSGEKPN